MDSEDEDKIRQWRRLQRQIPHWRSHEEEQQRKQAAKARRAAEPKESSRRQRSFGEDDEPFAKMQPRARQQPRAGPQPEATADLPHATVVAIHQGRVELLPGGSARNAPRLLTDPEFRLAVGDEVAFSTTSGPPRIEARLPRRSWLGRPDPGNRHLHSVLAANVDIAVIVVSVADPPLRPGLIDRYLLALAHGGVRPVVCVNKVDLLPAGTADGELAAAMSPYRALAVPVVIASASHGDGMRDLRARIAGTTCVFVGHSGVGKSSLLNAIDPDGAREVGAVHASAGTGRHTTTGSCLRTLVDGTRVIDTPGIRAFGVDGLSAEEVRAGFTEFAPFALACRFRDCSHRDEPDCAVRAAAATGSLPRARYESYRRIVEGLEA